MHLRVDTRWYVQVSQLKLSPVIFLYHIHNIIHLHIKIYLSNGALAFLRVHLRCQQLTKHLII